MREVAARKATLEAQGINVESRSERKRRLIREAAARTEARAKTRPSSDPAASLQPQARHLESPSGAARQSPSSLPPETGSPAVKVEFKKRRRPIPPDNRSD